MKKPINIIGAIRTEELRLSKRDLQAELRAMGFKLHSFSLAQLTAEARRRQGQYAHIAARNILRWQLEREFQKVRKRSAQSADTSAIRMSAIRKEPA
jgi:hypothetical protein